MEIWQLAERILASESLADKLRPGRRPLTDKCPGAALRVTTPARLPGLTFAPRRAAPAMPAPAALADPRKRAVAHHIMANHELQAAEVMAFVICAFPDAPADFRSGLAQIIGDEQRHTRMHMSRAAELGLQFGELPVNGYIWKKSQAFENILDYVAGLSLTFENRNLDHTLEFEQYFRDAGDERSAAVMRTIHRDEIGHVAFGLEWLRRLKPKRLSEWEAYTSHLHWPLRPSKAIGDAFHRTPRLAAGMTEEFVSRLEQTGFATDEESSCAPSDASGRRASARDPQPGESPREDKKL